MNPNQSKTIRYDVNNITTSSLYGDKMLTGGPLHSWGVVNDTAYTELQNIEYLKTMNRKLELKNIELESKVKGLHSALEEVARLMHIHYANPSKLAHMEGVAEAYDQYLVLLTMLYGPDVKSLLNTLANK